MKRFLGSINSFLRRVICRIFGHTIANMSLRIVGLRVCRRCRVITEQKTVRARVTRGEIEERMRDHPPEGYSFVSVNWRKRKARFMSPSGSLRFVTL